MPSPALMWRSLGVRSRVRVVFVASAVLLALSVGVIIWAVSSRYLLGVRQYAGVRQAQASAAAVQGLLTPANPGLAEQARALAGANESGVLVVRRNEVLAAAGLDPGQVPPRLRQLVDSGSAARQRVRIDGEVRLLVGIPLSTGAGYYQSLPFRNLNNALRALRLTLLLAGVLGVLLGALLAQLATRGALRPIDELTTAAQAVARGELATRMPEDDRDLAPLARVFNTTTADLERRVKADARFASDVSHELRTPLTTMANALAVLQRRRDQLPEAAGEAVGLLESQLARFQRLVVDLLDIAVVTEDRRHVPTEPVHLAELIRQMASANQWGHVQVPDEPLVVLGDPRLLERIVANLVRNAQSHGQGLVRISLRRRSDTARIEVDDAGPGVPAEDHAHIFERFVRGAGSTGEAPPGAGLGLALVAELAALHHGRAWVEDRPEGGARFVVELPLEAT